MNGLGYRKRMARLWKHRKRVNTQKDSLKGLLRRSISRKEVKEWLRGWVR